MKLNFNKLSKQIVIALFLVLSASLWAQKYPVSSIDGKSNTVVLQAKPEHIISLGAASTEILYKVGAGSQIVAVTDVCNYPEEATKLPVLGQFGGSSISVETLLSYDPDFVILYSGMHDYLIPTLEKYSIPFYVSDATSINEVVAEVKRLATLTGHEKEGAKLEKEYNNQLKAIQKKNATLQKKNGTAKVYWEVWYDPYMSAGGPTFINDVIMLAGGENIFAQETQGYPVVSEESIIAADPTCIMIPSDSFIAADAVKARRGWDVISAVKNNKVFIFNADIYSRPGPRIFDAIKELNAVLYE